MVSCPRRLRPTPKPIPKAINRVIIIRITMIVIRRLCDRDSKTLSLVGGTSLSSGFPKKETKASGGELL